MTALDLLSVHPFLEGLPPESIERLSAWARRQHFRAGTTIFAEGGRADRFWLIREGHVQLDLHLPGTGRVIVESLGAGAMLGWSWLFPPHTWHFGATAVEATLTVEFDGHGVQRLCDADPALGYELMRRFTGVVVDRLQTTRVRMLDLYRAP